MIERPAFTVGIEEEYLVVDRETRDLVKSPPPGMWAALSEVLGSQVTHEFLKAQIEVGTRVCSRVSEAREDLARLRRDLAAVVSEYGAAIIASSTHPFARWAHQETTEEPRYMRLAADYQQVARQLVICGMHIHVGIEDDHLRIDLMNQVGYFLPHLLALSTSSPFWRGEDTGLKSYRMAVFNELPRTGLPEHFESFGEYRRQLAGQGMELQLHADPAEPLAIRLLDAQRREIQLDRQVRADGDQILGQADVVGVRQERLPSPLPRDVRRAREELLHRAELLDEPRRGLLAHAGDAGYVVRRVPLQGDVVQVLPGRSSRTAFWSGSMADPVTWIRSTRSRTRETTTAGRCARRSRRMSAGCKSASCCRCSRSRPTNTRSSAA